MAQINENRHSIHISDYDEVMPLFREALSAGQSVTFMPRGKSMLPMLREGRDSVTVSPITADIRKYDVVFYKRESGKYVMHRVVFAGETYSFCGDNQYVFEKGITREQCIAIVTSYTRKGKPRSVRSFGNKLYCRALHYSRPFRYFIFRALRKLKRIFGK